MKTRHFALSAVAPALLLCSCYTVLRAPYSTTDQYYDDSRYSRTDQRDNMEPWLGRSDDRDGYRDPYGRYGPGAYGQPGYPIFGHGYDSRYGAFGSYGGYSPYSAGYGPYGYGYDPYYVGDGGVYIPPGYELVTTRELDRLRASDVDRSTTQNTDPGFDPVEFQQLQIQKAENAWSDRVNFLKSSKKPKPTRRYDPPPGAASKPSSSSSRSSSSSSSSTTSQERPSGKAKAKSRHQNR